MRQLVRNITLIITYYFLSLHVFINNKVLPFKYCFRFEYIRQIAASFDKRVHGSSSHPQVSFIKRIIHSDCLLGIDEKNKCTKSNRN